MPRERGQGRRHPYPRGGRGGRGRRLMFEDREMDDRDQLLARRRETIQQRLHQISEEDRFSLLTDIFATYPNISWMFLGRPGEGLQPTPPVAAPGVNWCQCGRCREMPTEVERVCCRATPCITLDPECALATQDRCSLNIGRAYHQDRWAQPAPDPEDPDGIHRQYRFQASQHYILWQFGYLGRGARRVIPSCVVWTIRDEFPNPNGDYVGYCDVPL